MFTIVEYDDKLGIRSQGYPSEFKVTAKEMNELLIEAVARMNSTELFDFISLLAYKWPTLSNQICQNLSSTLMDHEEAFKSQENENYGGTD
jgi:hypothetical protein